VNLHILGICGTFMGGLALLARELGHGVEGTDANAYPPMSTQLQRAGIVLHQGYSPGVFDRRPDLVVIGNALSRGNPCVEYVLDSGLPFVSGPEWLREEVLASRHVLAVSGTHGKSTTSAMLAWILEHAGERPGFLVGAVPGNFGLSARLGSGAHFVVEADEYDCAFFDKRAKFLHYRPRILVINNIEFDHADIYADLAAIRREFHHLVRTIPASGSIVVNGMDAEIARVLEAGCWTPVDRFGFGDLPWRVTDTAVDCSAFRIRGPGGADVGVRWGLPGAHNALNAAAALAAAAAAGIPAQSSADALGRFAGVQRRLQRLGAPGGVAVYDDFAHHPTAIRASVGALRSRVGSARIIAVMEPRSNTMKLGVHAAELAQAFDAADLALILRPSGLTWDLDRALAAGRTPHAILDRVEEILARLVRECRAGDHVLIMSNGGFGGIHARLLEALA
jgi:UDP-N-acetylmuramate: L-alanyl-gamma-D-glutamyl-meso-diaminopimelate ligase